MRMCPRLASFISYAAIILFLTFPSVGGSSEPAEEITGEAARRYQEGRAFYRDEQYAKAARRMREALEIADHPLLFYNAALAEWRAGRFAGALELANRAERRRLSEKVDVKNSGLRRGLERRLRAADIAERMQDVARVGEPPTDPVRPDPGGLTGWGWGGIAGLALGVGGLSGAIWIDRRLTRKSDRLRSAANQYELDKFERLRSEVRTEKRVGLGLLGGGIVFTGVGGYLLVHDLLDSRSSKTDRRPPSPDSSEFVVRPSWGPQRFGVQCRLSW